MPPSSLRTQGPITTDADCNKAVDHDAKKKGRGGALSASALTRGSPLSRGRHPDTITWNAASRLSGFLEQFTSDQHTAYFRRAGANFIELGVAQQPAGRVIVD